MKIPLYSLLIGLGLLIDIRPVGAQTARFFRIIGPTATTIRAFDTDGTIVWSGANPGATYQVQTASSLAGGTNWVDYVQLPVANSVNTNLLVSFNPPAGMMLIPAGTFRIGDTLDGESNAIPMNVYVSAFYMDTNLVSLSQWQGVYSYATNHGYSFVQSGKDKAANYPVETVDWYDCVKWSNARSAQAGLTPLYYTDVLFTQVYTNGETDAVYPNWAANGYRLPTEAEWEKASRGGLSGNRFPWGNLITENLANYYGSPGSPTYDLGPSGFNSIGSIGGRSPATSPVGSFAANSYGLYDMAGNVYEWCWDWYGTPYGQPTKNNPTGAGPGSGLRVLRGGYWLSDAYYARCAFRASTDPYLAIWGIGFRCVRGL
jgi:formylglycine-generating enzyme required for sulfatase activity